MRVLFDTNIFLDVLFEREPFLESALSLLSSVASGQITGVVCATSVTTLYYLGCKSIGQTRTRKHIDAILMRFEVAPVNENVLRTALSSGVPDFEDGVIYEAALTVGAEAIITRDKKGFRKSSIPVLSPHDLNTRLRSVP